MSQADALSLAESGSRKIEWAWRYMPVLRALRDRYASPSPLAGRKLACCLHLEAKTACFLLTLKDLGATVFAAGSNPLSTQDDVCAALVERGVVVHSRRGMSMEEYSENLRKCLREAPDFIIDDGADMVYMLHSEMPEVLSGVLGGCEETTTGIKRLRAMNKEGILRIPMIAVNDALSKYLFDNRYGTGQSVWDAISRLTNRVVAGSCVVVVGYGWCGKGVAKRAQGLGARVIVVEVDPHKALEAHMDGFGVMDMKGASREGDFFITVTGNVNVIRGEHFALMKNGAILANAGHFDVEVSLPDLERMSRSVKNSREGVRTYAMEDGRELHLLAEGRLVNLAGGDGHPVEIMDLSFSSQLLSAMHLMDNPMDPGLYPMPLELDEEIARIKLQSLNLSLEELTDEQREYLNSFRD
ncbi:MAG: adenosylhomocysteinase [Thermanaerothrix sp.]|nr:adenosylhomocysteinase [Thermanaerothrix sp.]